jgi:plastocyanin
MRRHSYARLATVVALVVSLACLAPASASAATTWSVTMLGYDFYPAVVTIARGDQVKWRNEDFSDHDVKSNLSGYFKSPGGSGGLGRKDQYSHTFKQAGSFGYLCRVHEADDMEGTVVVPIKVTRNGSTFTITAASASTSGTKWRNRIQVRRPGSSTWENVSITTAKTATFTSSKHGTYQFRSAVKNANTGARSGWSPVVNKTR